MLRLKVRDIFEEIIVNKFRQLFMINSSMQANFEELYIDDTDYNSEDGLRKFINKMKRKYKFLGELKMNEIVYEISG